MSKLPACCKDHMDKKTDGGMGKGKALASALAAHKRGDHDGYKPDADGDGDLDGDSEVD